ncbi:MAG TPA: hypothetical protein VKE40_15065 [Gemmataceae bacterium]|nr:hypothetical protein [Gemmataceae bacterium]
MRTDLSIRFGIVAGVVLATISSASLRAQDPPDKQPPPGTKLAIPETWDEARLESLHIPLAEAARTPKEVPKAYYTSFPIRPIYKSYDVYRPDLEPKDYFEWLKKQEPEVVWDEKKTPPLNTEADWVKAGEVVFDAPSTWENAPVRDPEWYKSTQAALTADGKLPFYRYVIRTKGKVEVGVLSCAMCHTRVLPDKSVVKGAQGNFPFGRILAYDYRKMNTALSRFAELSTYGAPWLRPDPLSDLAQKSVEDIAAAHEVIPPGVLARRGTGVWSPVQVPDLIGIKDRKYLDRTGQIRHRDIGDVMRYAALGLDADRFSLYGDFRSTAPNAKSSYEKLPPPRPLGMRGGGRYSDVQLYALAKYLYALQPPANPNLPKTEADRKLVARGEAVFGQLRCARCHSGDLYTNNKLTPVDGFTVPAEHREKYDILEESVGTDPTLALGTRRGTGYYKVPSLRGVWYRGPFEHNGSVATLEDWFDPRRLRPDYEPTGWKGLPGTKTRAVPGHRFGLNLPADDRRALIAFLKTL